jgi:recombination protein U
MIEAKYTDTDRISQSRVTKGQADYLEEQYKLGAICYIVVGFSSGMVYRIVWSAWRDMKERYGRKYVTEADIEKYQVQEAADGTLLLLDKLKGVHSHECKHEF